MTAWFFIIHVRQSFRLFILFPSFSQCVPVLFPYHFRFTSGDTLFFLWLALGKEGGIWGRATGVSPKQEGNKFSSTRISIRIKRIFKSQYSHPHACHQLTQKTFNVFYSSRPKKHISIMQGNGYFWGFLRKRERGMDLKHLEI